VYLRKIEGGDAYSKSISGSYQLPNFKEVFSKMKKSIKMMVCGMFGGVTLLLPTLLLTTFSAGDAEAVPSFARATGKSCASCHTVWPMLNKEGRKFKEAGYVSGDEKDAEGGTMEVADSLTLAKNAFSAQVNSRLYDKKSFEKDPGNDKDVARMRSLHEIELFIAGIAGNNLSTFVEAKAEDEVGNTDFILEIAAGVVGFHPNEAANIYFGFAEPTFADPYSAYANGRRVTRGGRGVEDKGFITGGSQFVSLSGRTKAIPRLFYLAAISANNRDDYEHTPLGNSSFRAVYDATPWLSIGGLYQQEKAKHNWAGNKYGSESDASNVGIDATVQFEDGLDANICYVQRDNREAKEKNNILAIEAGYPLKLAEVQIVPYCRVEQYTKNDGKDTYTDYHFSVNHIIRPNLRGVLNYEMIDKGTGGNDESRITLVADLGF